MISVLFSGVWIPQDRNTAVPDNLFTGRLTQLINSWKVWGHQKKLTELFYGHLMGFNRGFNSWLTIWMRLKMRCSALHSCQFTGGNDVKPVVPKTRFYFGGRPPWDNHTRKKNGWTCDYQKFVFFHDSKLRPLHHQIRTASSNPEDAPLRLAFPHGLHCTPL